MPEEIVSIPRVAPAAYTYIKQVLDFGFHNAHSAGMTARLEQEFAAKFGVRFGILQCNGTTTMHTGLLAAGVGPGDEVIVPALTMASTALAVIHAGAIPIFADSDPHTFTIDPDDIKRKLTSRTKAIIPVAIYGLAPDMDQIMALAKEHGLSVIEDNAQCYLGYYKGRLLGSIGDMASFSFQSSKHMTCGEGGILITDDEELATQVRRVMTLGYGAVSAKPGRHTIPEEMRCSPSFPRHAEFGYNFRLGEIAAAVALAEFERLEELVRMRQACAAVLDEVVQACDWLIPQKTPKDYVHSYWCYTALIADDGPDWHQFRKTFVESGGDGFYGCWRPVYREPAFENFKEIVDNNPRQFPQYVGVLPDYRQSLCPVLEKIQPRLVQLKTNYFELGQAKHQAELLAETIRQFS